MERSVFKSSLRSRVSIALLLLMLLILAGLVLTIMLPPNRPFTMEYLVDLLLTSVCLYYSCEIIYVGVKYTKTICFNDACLSVGKHVFEWKQLTKWDLSAKRRYGIGGDSYTMYMPAAVFVFGDETEVRIFYHLYSDGKLLKQTLEEVITILPQGRVEAQSKQDATCPRCLGKGYVNEDDIERLHKERVWEPGECLLCKGTGVVQQ